MTALIVAEPGSNYGTLPSIVVDCSVIAALVFDEPASDEARSVLRGKALHAPWLIDHEMVSVSLKKAGAGLAEIARDGLLAFSRLRLIRSQTNLQAQYELALRFGLSAYDAAYLQLAVDLSAPLATFDRKLGQAAGSL